MAGILVARPQWPRVSPTPFATASPMMRRVREEAFAGEVRYSICWRIKIWRLRRKRDR